MSAYEQDTVSSFQANLVLLEAERKERKEALSQLQGALEMKHKESFHALHETLQVLRVRIEEVASIALGAESRAVQELQNIRVLFEKQPPSMAPQVDIQAVAKAAAAAAAATAASHQKAQNASCMDDPELQQQLSEMVRSAVDGELVVVLNRRMDRMEEAIQSLFAYARLERARSISPPPRSPPGPLLEPGPAKALPGPWDAGYKLGREAKTALSAAVNVDPTASMEAPVSRSGAVSPPPYRPLRHGSAVCPPHGAQLSDVPPPSLSKQHSQPQLAQVLFAEALLHTQGANKLEQTLRARSPCLDATRPPSRVSLSPSLGRQQQQGKLNQSHGHPPQMPMPRPQRPSPGPPGQRR